MNIFVLDTDPRKAAQMQCDKHILSGINETVQILSTAFNLIGIIEERLPYPPKRKKYPLCRWAADSTSNLNWTLRYGKGLSKEYSFRYGKRHQWDYEISNMSHIFWEECVFDATNIEMPQSFIQAMPEKYKVTGNAVHAYRNYYKAEKAYLAKWNNGREAPQWWKGQQIDMKI